MGGRGPEPTSEAAVSRNHLIDAARAASVFMVLVFHVVFFRFEWVAGDLVMSRWEPEPPWWPVTWVTMLLPLFFVAGGYGHAVSIDRMHTQGTTLARFLVNNGRRIIGPLLLFNGAVVLIATVAAWLPGEPPLTPYPLVGDPGWPDLAADLSRDYGAFLWFIPVYLVIIATAVPAVRLHDRFGVWVPVGLALAAATIDAWSITAGDMRIRYLNWLLVWPLCHQLGIGYERGWFRRGPVGIPVAGAVAGAAAVWVLNTYAGYPGSAIVSYYPPTLALGFLALAQVSALGLLERAGFLGAPPAHLQRRLGAVNLVLVTIYLWLNTSIVLAVVGLITACGAFPGGAPFLLSPFVIVVASVLVLRAIIPPLARLDRRLMPPLGRKQHLGFAIAGYVLLVVGTLAGVLHGIVLHPTQPWAGAAVLLVWAGAGLVALAAGGRVRRAGRDGAPAVGS